MLNDKQNEAVQYDGNELLVLAGAGSGKTKCVTEKVAMLIERGISINEIVAITFTNKAANEMVERISSSHHIDKKQVFICTFHSFCFKILKEEIKYLGWKRIRVCSENQSQDVLSDACKSVGKDNSDKAKSEIEKLKNRLIYPGDPQLNRNWVKPIYEQYQEIMESCFLLDFNDIISKTVLMLKSNAEIREKYQRKFKYIIVDEFQDVNNAQFELVKILHNKDTNKLMVVGDDSQCVEATTMIRTPKCKMVAKLLDVGDNVLSYKNGKVVSQEVVDICKSSWQEGYKITTKSGKTLTMTPNHKIWATQLQFEVGKLYHYLMVNDKWSIGCCYYNDNIFNTADLVWILDIFDNKEIAIKKLSESYFGNDINEAFSNNIIHCNEAFGIIQNTFYTKGFPHIYNPLNSSLIIDVNAHTVFGTFVSTFKNINTNEPLGFGGTKMISKSQHNFTINSFESYTEAIQLAKHVRGDNSFVIIREKLKDAVLTVASALFSGMKVLVYNDNDIEYDEILNVERVRGDFLDINVKDASNFFGNDILSHNSIYGFRDSDPSFIVNFSNEYPESKQVTLERNYRSSDHILAAANYVIDKNKFGLKKELWTEKDKGDKISVAKLSGDKTEARFVADKIIEEHKRGITYSEIGILYRLNSLSRPIQDALAESAIPFKVVKGQSFFDRKEVRDLMGYLHFLDNPNDLLSFRRCAQIPKRKIGLVTLSDMINQSNKNKVPILTVAKEHKKLEVREFAIMLDEMMDHKKDATILIPNLMEEIGYEDYLSGIKGKTTVQQRLESIDKIIEISSKWAKDKTLKSLMEHLTLNNDTDKDESDSVTLTTIHSAKGLEYNTVFLIGMNKGNFPHEMLDRDIEEARRLFYVAITRAKRKLYISHTEYSNYTPNEPSVFISELPKHVTENLRIHNYY